LTNYFPAMEMMSLQESRLLSELSSNQSCWPFIEVSAAVTRNSGPSILKGF
jgi:hypothetical protein